MQLARIPGGKSTSRAAKQRSDLLLSFDTLTSHFNTTFTALSTAFARRLSKPQISRLLPKDQSDHDALRADRARAYLAILVGPSIGSAKSKVIFAIDGLETKVWGERDDLAENTDAEEEAGVEDERERERTDTSAGEELGDDEEGSESEGSESEGENSDYSDSGPSPPQSRSPSPSPPPPYTSHAERQQTLHLADRLLSRMLASAEADGNGMASEMCHKAPTQTHILLRAPRRFVHPVWIPRQNVTASLEATLDEFLEESGLRAGTQDHRGHRKAQGGLKGKRVEGVWITCRDGLEHRDAEKLSDVGDDDEGDEMIWWSWDGKIIGFSDW